MATGPGLVTGDNSFTIAGVVRRWSNELPDAPAVVADDEAVTWQELYGRATRVAQALAAEGVGEQDRIAFLDRNSCEFLDVLFGAATLNAVTVAVNWRLTRDELVAVLNDSQAKVLFVGAEWNDGVTDMAGDLPTVQRIVPIERRYGDMSFESWLAPQRAHDPGVVCRADDVALQLYTSGTTGDPKGVMLTNEGLGGFMAYGARFGVHAGSVVLASTPQFHVAGCGWSLIGLTAGATIVLLRDFEPSAVLEAIRRRRVTHCLFVPAMLMSLVRSGSIERADLSSMELIMYGASPISESLLTRCMDVFACDICQTYGLTETSGAITMLTADDHRNEVRRDRLRSAGKPMGDVELRIVDPQSGRDVPDGDIGEVWVRTTQLMKGYWNRELETRRALDGGWFRTGDAGYRRDGYLYLYDRINDMIVTGGENVYSAEVENVLMAHPAVTDVAVIGVPSDRWGEAVAAVVVPATTPAPDPAELIEFARTSLAGYKVPKSVTYIECLPRTPSGKVLKTELRAPVWAGRDRRIG